MSGNVVVLPFPLSLTCKLPSIISGFAASFGAVFHL